MEPPAPVAGVTGMTTARPGAHEAVRELYTVCYGRLVGVVALAAGSRAEAEECVQEAFVRLLGHWARVSRYEDPEAWLRQVAFRLLANRMRKARNGVRALLRHGPPVRAPEPNADRVDVAQALDRLPLGQRQVVVLHYLVGLDVAEVARVLGTAPGTVKS